MNPVLILKKGNTILVINDWEYCLAPTTYYHRIGIFNVEIYEYDYMSKCKRYAFYKLL